MPQTLREARAFLEYIRSLPCLVCQNPSTFAHHLLRTGDRGMGYKSPDRYAVPLCNGHHRELHRLGDESSFFLRYGIDPYRWVRDVNLRFWAQPIAGEQYGNIKPRIGLRPYRGE